MQKQTFIFVTVLVISFAALGAGAYFLLQLQKDRVENSRKPSTDVSLQATKPAKENIPASNSTLQVQGANTVAPEQQKQQLPTPDQFKVYEQFANSATVQYQDTSVGTGEIAMSGDTVAMVYKGWLTDGTLFDKNRVNELNQIETFGFTLGAGQVIQGWEQGIDGMKEGGKRRLIVPASVGYGESGQGQLIPPNAMLIFDVELIQVQKPTGQGL
jgi:FKBP-type peptidyl-prolyl cis-trans isomerase FkpA